MTHTQTVMVKIAIVAFAVIIGLGAVRSWQARTAQDRVPGLGEIKTGESVEDCLSPIGQVDLYRRA